jgi:hypothetical protein
VSVPPHKCQRMVESEVLRPDPRRALCPTVMRAALTRQTRGRTDRRAVKAAEPVIARLPMSVGSKARTRRLGLHRASQIDRQSSGAFAPNPGTGCGSRRCPCAVRRKHLGTAATGRSLNFPLCGIFTFDQRNKLAGEKIYYDRATVLGQLGIFHEPETLRGRIATAITHPVTMVRILARLVADNARRP